MKQEEPHKIEELFGTELVQTYRKSEFSKEEQPNNSPNFKEKLENNSRGIITKEDDQLEHQNYPIIALKIQKSKKLLYLI